MFGYKLIKKDEFEELKIQLKIARETAVEQSEFILKLEKKIKELENKISKLTKSSNVKNENNEEKPVKKVRRKSSKKTSKKEE